MLKQFDISHRFDWYAERWVNWNWWFLPLCIYIKKNILGSVMFTDVRWVAGNPSTLYSIIFYNWWMFHYLTKIDLLCMWWIFFFFFAIISLLFGYFLFSLRGKLAIIRLSNRFGVRLETKWTLEIKVFSRVTWDHMGTHITHISMLKPSSQTSPMNWIDNSNRANDKWTR